MKVIVKENLGAEYASDLISSCNQSGIQAIADYTGNEILFYDPKNWLYGRHSDMMKDASLEDDIFSIFNGKTPELRSKVLKPAKGEDFREFAVEWNNLQKQENPDIIKTKNCSMIRFGAHESGKPRSWKKIGKPKKDDGLSQDDLDFLDKLKNTDDKFGRRVNGIEARVSEGGMNDSVVVYFKDKSKEPMTLANVHDLEGAFDSIRYMLSHEPGDIADIDHIKIGSKVYDRDDIDDYLGHEHELEELDSMYSENIDDPRDWSASEGEVEIMWTRDFPEAGIEAGNTDNFVVDYDNVAPDNEYDIENNGLRDEICRLISKEYPELDFEDYDFDITNEREFWGD